MQMVNELISIGVGAFSSMINALFEYLSFHVLSCLIPAFFIAGAMNVFVSKETVIKYLGKSSHSIVSYSFALISGFLLAVCSCTVLPLFAAIWKRGAGLGPAIVFLFVAPAINILAITYTGSLIGMDIAIARLIFAIIVAILIGVIMANLFPNLQKNEVETDQKPQNLNFPKKINYISIILYIMFILDSLILIISDNLLFSILGITHTFIVQMVLFFLGLTLLFIISYFSGKINSTFVLFLWLFFILFTGTAQIKLFQSNYEILSLLIDIPTLNMLLKLVLISLPLIGLIIFFKNYFDYEDLKDWFTETWFFVKQIFPLIIIGVAIVGLLQFFLPANLLSQVAGNNTLMSNSLGVIFGIFMYFPTLMEVPIAKLFLDLGMAHGPLLAYLLADPELSIQSILVTRNYLGDKANVFYVILVFIFTVVIGLVFGFILGEGIGLI